MAAVEIAARSPYSTSIPFSRLLNLPPEIRSQIFHFAILPSHPSTPSSIHTCASTYLSLQLTSRAIYHETYLLPFRHLPLVMPGTFGSNIAASLRFLRKLQPCQVGAIRRIELSMLGSVFEGVETGRALKYLQRGDEQTGVIDWIYSPDVAVFAAGEYQDQDEDEDMKAENEQNGNKGVYASDLKELDIKIISRDVMTPMADSAVGMGKTLDLETSPVFGELVKLKRQMGRGTLRDIRIGVELGPSLKEVYAEEWVKGWREDLCTRLNALGDGDGDGQNESDPGNADHHHSDASRDAKAWIHSAEHHPPHHYSTFSPVNLQVTFNSSPEMSAVMSGYFKALGGDEDDWFSEAGTNAAE